jgi:glycerol uptake facilitator-like aquaporin
MLCVHPPLSRIAAITFGLTITRHVTLLRGLLYVVAQCFGAIVGSWLSMSIEKSTFDRVGGGVNGSHRFTSGPQITAEFIATALLVFTVFAVIDPGRNQSVIHIAVLGPFAIGMAVCAHMCMVQ